LLGEDVISAPPPILDDLLTGRDALGFAPSVASFVGPVPGTALLTVEIESIGLGFRR
jgi:hypothetical protein